MSDMAQWCAEQERREKDALAAFRTAFGQALEYSRKKHPGFVRDVFRSPGYLRLMLADLRKKDTSSQTLLEVLLEESMELCEALMDGNFEGALQEAGQIAAVAARAVGPEGKCLLGRRGEEKYKVVTTYQTIPEEGATNPPPCDILGHSEIKKTCSVSEQVPKKPVLPKWCKVGRWMFDNDGALCEIVEVQPHQILVRYPGTKLELRIFVLRKVRPVRFREYTFEEAGELAGKGVECEYGDADSTYKALEIVHYVILTPGGTVTINDKTFREWQCLNATIDGVPFGVPEVDAEAEKESQK